MFEKINKTCKYVIDNSQYVKINYNKIDEFITKIDTRNLRNWLLI